MKNPASDIKIGLIGRYVPLCEHNGLILSVSHLLEHKFCRHYSYDKMYMILIKLNFALLFTRL